MAFNSVKNYYEILDVSTDAQIFEIKSAYRTLARKYHPDVNKSPEAINIFKEVTLAYETLSNEEKRKQYDILNGIFKPSPKQKQPNPQPTERNGLGEDLKKQQAPKTEAKSSREQKTKKTKDKKNQSVSFTKLIKYWAAKLEKNKRAKNNRKPQKGENLTTEVTITPDEVMTGSKRIINIRTTRTCPQCMGHRFANGAKCSKCAGKGSVTETKKITLTIPKGIRDGAKLRLKGEGACGKNGAPNGDVFVVVRIETKTQVHFDKLNIYYNVPVTPFEAALGEEITIPAFDGTIKLKLPKNTTSGQKFRIAKQGLKKGDKIGDLIVTVSIEISKDLSDDEIRLYEQLKKLSKDNVRKNFGYGS